MGSQNVDLRTLTNIPFKSFAKWATTGALPAGTWTAGTFEATSNGVYAPDGTNIALGDRVLIKDEVSAPTNCVAICIVAGAVGAKVKLKRDHDFDASEKLLEGALVIVESGDQNANTLWIMPSKADFVLNTDNVIFGQPQGTHLLTKTLTLDADVDGTDVTLSSTLDVPPANTGDGGSMMLIFYKRGLMEPSSEIGFSGSGGRTITVKGTNTDVPHMLTGEKLRFVYSF